MGLTDDRIQEIRFEALTKCGTNHDSGCVCWQVESIHTIVAEAVKPWEEALNRSEFDISPCRQCGLPVVCIPDGMSAWCNECAKSESEGGS